MALHHGHLLPGQLLDVPAVLNQVCGAIREAAAMGVQVGVVVGAGNFWRGVSLHGPGLSGICGVKDFGKRAKNPIKSQHLFDFGIYHWMAAGGGESFLIFFDLELKICLFFSEKICKIPLFKPGEIY